MKYRVIDYCASRGTYRFDSDEVIEFDGDIHQLADTLGLLWYSKYILPDTKWHWSVDNEIAGTTEFLCYAEVDEGCIDMMYMEEDCIQIIPETSAKFTTPVDLNVWYEGYDARKLLLAYQDANWDYYDEDFMEWKNGKFQKREEEE